MSTLRQSFSVSEYPDVTVSYDIPRIIYLAQLAAPFFGGLETPLLTMAIELGLRV